MKIENIYCSIMLKGHIMLEGHKIILKFEVTVSVHQLGSFSGGQEGG